MKHFFVQKIVSFIFTYFQKFFTNRIRGFIEILLFSVGYIFHLFIDLFFGQKWIFVYTVDTKS